MTVSPGLTPANASVSAGLRSASRCLSSSGRALSATAAVTYAGIEGAAQASEAARAAIAGAAIAPIVARCMDFLLLAVDLTAARHSIRSDRRSDIVSPRRAIAATLVTG